MDESKFVPERLDEWAYWITEREKIRVRKEKDAGQKGPPYHKDPVMANTRWCNVRRMDDRVSLWLLDNWYPGDDIINPKSALLAGLLGRMINQPETLAYITGGEPFTRFDYDRYLERMYEVKASGKPVFTGAYIINGASGGPKIEQVLGAIRRAAERIGADKQARCYVNRASMQATAESLHELPGVGSFIAGQVVADLRHVLEGSWGDKMTWAPVGPGSSRGMKYLLGQISAVGTAGRGNDMGQKEFLSNLRKLIRVAREHPKVGPIFEERELEAQDIQSSLCELGKYIRIKYKAGRAKNPYPPKPRKGR